MSTKPIEVYLARFCEWMKRQGWSGRTIESYAGNIRFFITYLKEETHIRELSQITSDVLYSYQSHVYHSKTTKGRRLSLSTQHTRLVSLRSFFRYLHSHDLIFANPSAELKLPKKRKNLPHHIMTLQQIEQLLDAPDVSTALGFRDRTIMEVMYASALRNSELRNLTIYDVETNEMTLMVRQGKGDRDRIVPVGETACEYVREYLQVVRQELSADPEQDLLFVSKNGRQITQANLVWIIRKYVKAAALPEGITPHSFRHTCATHMLKNGADLRYIQQMLGHASVETTQRYTKVENADLREVHRRCHPRERDFDAR